MLKRLSIALFLATALLLGQTPNERLVATTKLWAYVKYFHPGVTAPAAGVKPGDVLVSIDGKPYKERADDLALHVAASTPQSMMARVLGTLLNGDGNSQVRATFRVRERTPSRSRDRKGANVL